MYGEGHVRLAALANERNELRPPLLPIRHETIERFDVRALCEGRQCFDMIVEILRAAGI